MYADFHQNGKLPEYSVLSFKNKKMPQKKGCNVSFQHATQHRESGRRNSATGENVPKLKQTVS